MELFITLAQERGWKVLLPGLVSQTRSQTMASHASAENKGALDKFNKETFHQHLLKFIVADDQVCFLYSKSMCTSFILCCHCSVIECCQMSRISVAFTSPPEQLERKHDPTPQQVA